MMMAVVDRIAGFGLRTLGLRTKSACRRTVGRPKRMAAACGRLFGSFGRMAAAGTALWSGAGIVTVHASEREAAVVQTGVGTLPLLAAMAIGICIAAAAVIAFLQMTAKAKNVGDKAADDDAEPWPSESSAAEDRADSFRESDESLAGLEDALPDYTIPLPAMRRRPEAAVPAREGSPRLWGVEGEFAGSGFKLSDCWLTLGRDAAQCGIIFPYDAGEISRKHCSLRFEAERGLFLIEDHHSSNGTFLSDGERLEPGVIYELRPGARFSLSGERHWFEVQI
ncbi:anti-sigma factor RsiW [Cohnella lubricantis]|nr:anti-sigma factor RsiW [Cohnella lubricantis]